MCARVRVCKCIYNLCQYLRYCTCSYLFVHFSDANGLAHVVYIYINMYIYVQVPV